MTSCIRPSRTAPAAAARRRSLRRDQAPQSPLGMGSFVRNRGFKFGCHPGESRGPVSMDPDFRRGDAGGDSGPRSPIFRWAWGSSLAFSAPHSALRASACIPSSGILRWAWGPSLKITVKLGCHPGESRGLHSRGARLWTPAFAGVTWEKRAFLRLAWGPSLRGDAGGLPIASPRLCVSAVNLIPFSAGHGVLRSESVVPAAAH